MSDEPRTCAHAHTHTFTPLLSSFCGSQLPDCITHWTLPPLPASLSFQMSYVRHPALRDKDRNSVSKWDLATSKLSSDSCRKGAWGGSTMQWQGRRETPPPNLHDNSKNRCTMSVWKSLFLPLCSLEVGIFHYVHATQKIGCSGITHGLHPNSCAIMYEWWFCHYFQKNMWLSGMYHFHFTL